MDFFSLFVALGVIGGIGLIIGAGTGFARGRVGLSRWRAVLMSCLYAFLLFPVAIVALYLLLTITETIRWNPERSPALIGRLFVSSIVAGLIAALPAAAAAFFAHVLSWNRHHARMLGTQRRIRDEYAKPPEPPNPSP